MSDSDPPTAAGRAGAGYAGYPGAFPDDDGYRRDGLAVALDGTVFALGGFVEVADTLETTDARGAHAEPDAFRSAMAFRAAVVVLVTNEVSGRPWGLTVSACCSVSLDPPLVLVSLNRRTESWRSISRTQRFGISILRADQLSLAQRAAAAGSPKFVDEFCDDPADPAPAAIRGALFHLDCTVENAYVAGTHALVVGRVRRTHQMSSESPAQPLVYYNRTFHGLGDRL
jgi:flavin reductase ActVB